MLLRLLPTVALLTLSCSHAQTTSPPPQSIATASPAPTVQATSTATTAGQPIRSINFCNVAFPRYPEFIGDRGRKKYVTRKPRDGCPAQLDYGDVNGDGAEEAMMMLGIENRGSAIPEIVYIFTLANDRPKLPGPSKLGTARTVVFETFMPTVGIWSSSCMERIALLEVTCTVEKRDYAVPAPSPGRVTNGAARNST